MNSGPQFIIPLGAAVLGEAGSLVRIPIAILGRFVKGPQKFRITREDLQQVVTNFHKRQADLVVDYEHASEFPEAAQGQPIPAAGWLKQIEDEPDGKGILWGLAAFTERARRMIAVQEYKYLSPAIAWGTRDKGTGEQQGATLTSMALVNRPFLEAMPAIQLSEAGWTREDSGQAEGEGNSMCCFDKLAATDNHIRDLEAELQLYEDEKFKEGGRSHFRAACLARQENPQLLKLREHLLGIRFEESQRLLREREGNPALAQLDQKLCELADAKRRENPYITVGGSLKMAAEENPALMRARHFLVNERKQDGEGGKVTEFQTLDQQFNAKVRELMQQRPGLSLKAAMVEAGWQHPELVRAREAAYRRSQVLPGSFSGVYEDGKLKWIEAQLGERLRRKMQAAPALTSGQAVKLLAAEDSEYRDLCRQREKLLGRN